MGLLSYLIPELNKPDKTEDPKTANALTAIEQWANGGIDEKNLTTAYAAFVAQLIPTGSVMPYAGAAAPSNWLLCDGSAVSRSTYSKLFETLSTTYGEGDKVTTFNLPDLRGRVAVGAGTATGAAGAINHVRGTKGGEESHTLTPNETALVNHLHGLGGATALAIGVGTEAYAPGAATTGGITQTGAPFPAPEANAVAAHNTMQPFVVVNHIIRT